MCAHVYTFDTEHETRIDVRIYLPKIISDIHSSDSGFPLLEWKELDLPVHSAAQQ